MFAVVVTLIVLVNTAQWAGERVADRTARSSKPW
jgi:ABC-type methionine transport system permease subunit